MNVAALLQDSPSDDHDQRRRQQQRDRERERENQHQHQHQQQQEQLQQQPPHHTPPQERLLDRDRPPQPPVYISPRPHHPNPAQSPHTRRQNPSPPPPHRPYPPPEYSHGHRGQLPPPSAFLPPPFELKPGRPHHPEPSRSQEFPGQLHHGSAGSIGHPGPPSHQYGLDHRSLPPPPRTHPLPPAHSQHHHHAHTQPSTPSAMYVPPPRPPPQSNPPGQPKSSSSMPPPGHGSMPLHPTYIGPGIPPSASPPSVTNSGPGIPPSRSMPSPRYSEPSLMYSGHPHQPAGLPGSHQRPVFDYGRGSPVMGSLQHPSLDERDHRDRARDRDRGDRDYDRDRDSAPGGPRLGPHSQPSSQLGSRPGSTHSLAIVGPAMNARQPPPLTTQMLTGPAVAVGINPNFGAKERERERNRQVERSQERDARMGGISESPGRREAERHHAKEKERDPSRDRMRPGEMEGLRPMEGPMVIDIDAERERYHHAQRVQQQMREQGLEQPWARTAPPRPSGIGPGMGMGEDPRERERRNIEMERERERQHRAEEARMHDRERAYLVQREEARRREAEWETQRLPGKDKSVARDRDDRRMIKASSGKDDQAEERERMMRERERAERHERERSQREQDDMDAIRRTRMGQPLQAPQHHDHHHWHHIHRHVHPTQPSTSQSHMHPSKPAKYAALAPGPHMQPGIGPGVDPGEMHPPFEQIQDRQQQPTVSKMQNGPGMGQPLPPHVMGPHRPQHQQLPHSISTGHIHQHPHPHLRIIENATPAGYVHRRTPPPGFAPPMPTSVSAPSAVMFVPPRSPSPRPIFAQPAVHLGTYIYPKSPFPYLDFPGSSSETDPFDQTREIRATILIPFGFLPTKRPARPRIWGGALIPALPPIPPNYRHPHDVSNNRPYTSEMRGMRRVYTDDSDLFLCVLHAGHITWSDTRRAKSDGRDLCVEVRITREARFIGGFGSPAVKAMSHGGMMIDQGADPEDDGRSLLSAGWGNSHDGAGIEILAAVFVEGGSAHRLGLKNRPQRLKEYAERRSVLCNSTRPRKRRRMLTPDSDVSDSPPLVEVEITDAQLCTTQSIISGDGQSWVSLRLKCKVAPANRATTPEDVGAEKGPASDSRKRRRSRSPSERLDEQAEPVVTGPDPPGVESEKSGAPEGDNLVPREPSEPNPVDVVDVDPPDKASHGTPVATVFSVESSNGPSDS